MGGSGQDPHAVLRKAILLLLELEKVSKDCCYPFSEDNLCVDTIPLMKLCQGSKNAKLLTTWVRVWPSGESSLLQTEKSALSSHLGIQARDFRIIEFQTARQVCSLQVKHQQK